MQSDHCHCHCRIIPLNIDIAVAIRFIRSLIGLQEEFYVKQLLEKDTLGPVLDVMYNSREKDNLLSSACLELFEHIKKESLKDFIKHLVVNHRPRLEALSSISTFDDLVLRYDQTQGYTSNMDFYLEADDDMSRKPPQNARMMEHLSVDPNEEAYWNTSDPEDEDEQHATVETKSQAGSETSATSRPLVDYASDEEAEENTEASSDLSPSEDATARSEQSEDHPVVPPPERLAEKRRREEDDEDELGKLLGNKRRNSTTSPRPDITGIARKRKSFSPGTGNGQPRKISISLSPALKSGSVGGRSDDES